MDIVLRTHASPEVGFGHLNRCKILSDAIREEGGRGLLLVNNHPSVQGFVEDGEIQYLQDLNQIEWPYAEGCIFDLYCYDASFYEKIRKQYKHIIIFDDFKFQIPPHVSAVINGNIFAQRNNYPLNTQAFIGTHYFLMRSEFLGKRQLDNAQNVLVCMGGSDPEEQTTRILKILSEVTTRNIDAVFGPGFEDELVIKKWSAHPQITVHCSVSNMSALMEKAVFCVSGAGSIMYELAHMGVPTACLSLIEHQRLIAEAFSKEKATNYLGFFDEIDDSEIARQLQILDQNESMRIKLSQTSQRIVDGLGPQRLAKDLMKWLRSKINE